MYQETPPGQIECVDRNDMFPAQGIMQAMTGEIRFATEQGRVEIMSRATFQFSDIIHDQESANMVIGCCHWLWTGCYHQWAGY